MLMPLVSKFSVFRFLNINITHKSLYHQLSLKKSLIGNLKESATPLQCPIIFVQIIQMFIIQLYAFKFKFKSQTSIDILLLTTFLMTILLTVYLVLAVTVMEV